MGTFNGNLTNSGGTLSPGHSTGSTTVNGDYTQQSRSDLEIEIGGSLAVSQFDFVNVTGTASLGGQLNLKLLGGYVPTPADAFTILIAGNLQNSFANALNGQRLSTADGLGSFLINYGPTSPFDPNQIRLTNFQTGSLPGDFNGNGAVENADLTLLLNNWAKPTSPTPTGWVGEPLTGPAVDNDELTALLNNWGKSVGNGGGSLVNVPEASTAMLAMWSVIVAGKFAIREGRRGRTLRWAAGGPCDIH